MEPVKLETWAQFFRAHGATAVVREYGLTRDDLSELLVFSLGSGDIGDLLIAGADPNYRDDEGGTPLTNCVHLLWHPAGEKPVQDVLRNMIALLAHGADPNCWYSDICSVTRLAVSADRPDVTALLLFSGAELQRPEPDGVLLLNVLASSDRYWARDLVRIASRKPPTRAASSPT